MKKQLTRLILTAALALSLASTAAADSGRATLLGASLDNFKSKASYTAGIFSDVGSGQWYDAYVKKTYELGIMNGKSGGIFDPEGNIRISEALKMACVVHNIYYGSGTVFAQNASPWYQPYVDYAINNGIVSQSYFRNYDAYATRENMAMLFARAIPESALPAINTIGVLPDVDEDSSSLQGIYMLYRAGVLTGNDSYGTFEKGSYITRAQAATIITRLAVASERKHFVLKTVSLTPEKTATLKTLVSWYNTTNRLKNICTMVSFGTSADAYFYDNGLVLLEQYASYNPDAEDYYEGSYQDNWYYMDGDVYCIVMLDPHNEETVYRLFFDNGTLLCWEDSDGNTYYNGYRWDAMQSEYTLAKTQCDSIAARYWAGDFT